MSINTTGVQGGLGVRLEIREFAQNPDLLNIYLLGLRRMQSADSTDSLSWYQIGGIHGRPFTPWDNVSGNGNRIGYCTHSSILFPSWHRPYLALFEQALYANIQEVVAGFPPGPLRARYDRLLPNFRIPYFDIAVAQSLPEILLSLDKVEVTLPTGKSQIANPLFSYHFSTPDQMDFAQRQFKNWDHTLRRPTNISPDAVSQPDHLKAVLEHHAPSLRERVYQLFSIDDFHVFAMNIAGRDHPSLEGVHNTGHGAIGGPGHMGDIGNAAFDPIFWLHHCNIDRLFAMWQVLYPDSYVVDHPSRNSTFWSNSGSIETSMTPLVPFRQDGSTMWNSETARDQAKFGSTYPELIDHGGGPAEVKMNVLTAVRKLYGRVPFARMIGGFAPDAAKSKAGIVKQRADNPAVTTNPTEVLRTETVPQTLRGNPATGASTHHNYYEYFANLHVEKYAIGGSFSVYIFIGDFTGDPYQQITDKNLVGTFDIFANDPESTGCEKCITESAEHLIVKESIPLTSALLDRIADDTFPELETMEPEAVTPFLKRHLHWRVHLPDGSEVPRESVLGLKVYVASAIVDVPDDESELPQYGALTPIYEITTGRPCGVEVGDDL